MKNSDESFSEGYSPSEHAPKSTEYTPAIQKLIDGKKGLMKAYESVAQVADAIDAELRAAWGRGEDATRGTMTAETRAKFATLYKKRDEADQKYERLKLELYRGVDQWLAETIYDETKSDSGQVE